ncbi:GTP-binding protein [Thalassoglobus neptunius]|uniref:GTP-binding protein n=1 Tax=Thalassoglobus neptunius TaxID=1938619 RepID=UPI001E524740|nr:GTP-binding protein [Thalassoglobus neptunius]
MNPLRSMREESTFQILTPEGRGAVASLQVTGDLDVLNRFFVAANRKTVQDQPVDRIAYGTWDEEDLVIVRTSASTAEIHCHGGHIAVHRIAEQLVQSGIKEHVVPPPSERSFEEEIDQLLQLATTRRTAHWLLRQRLSFPAAIQQLEQLSANELKQTVQSILQWSNFGLHLTQPWKVVLCGHPNVGKSTLMNALVGYGRSVVFDQPGTTRDVVTASTALEGWPIEFADTAGLRETSDELEALGVEKAQKVIEQADLAIIVMDATSGMTKADESLISHQSEPLVVWNKTDLLPSSKDIQSGLSISAQNGDGVDELANAIVQRLIPALPQEDQAIPVSQRQQDYLCQILESV